MHIAYVPGCWDILHAGHLAILERSKRLAGESGRLVVGVPSDSVVAEDKGNPPIIPLDERLQILSALRCVDLAIPYWKLEFLTHLESIKPSILIIGETWGSERRHVEAECWAADNHCRVIQLPYSHGISSTEIRAKIVEQSRNERF